MGSRIAQQGRGLSVRQLTFIFFGAVGVCAIFFALGYMMGANRRAAVAGPAVEQVLPSSPPPVDSPLRSSGSQGTSARSQGSAAVIEQNLKEASQTQAAASSPAAPNAPQGMDAAAKSSASRASAVATPASANPMQRGFMVQVAALRTEQDARSLLKVLQSRGYTAVIVTPEQAHAGDSLYRVQVGPFKGRGAAVKTLHKLGSQGFRPFIRE